MAFGARSRGDQHSTMVFRAILITPLRLIFQRRVATAK
jgi:hypothetical protein